MEDRNYKKEAIRATSYIVDKAYEEGYKHGVRDMTRQAKIIVDYFKSDLHSILILNSLRYGINMQEKYLLYDLKPWED